MRCKILSSGRRLALKESRFVGSVPMASTMISPFFGAACASFDGTKHILIRKSMATMNDIFQTPNIPTS